MPGRRQLKAPAPADAVLPDDDPQDVRPLIRTIAKAERPRERLLREGAATLSDVDLVAVLLRLGTPGQSALQMAAKLLRQVGGLRGLLGASATSLRRRGLGDAKASSVLAAIEIARRIAFARVPARRPMARPEEVAIYLSMRYRTESQEVMGAVFLDSRLHWIGDRALFRGTVNRAAVEPRPILREALLCNATGVVLFHTHPSGDPTPSQEDVAFTRRMAAAGSAVGVDLVDHLVLGTCGRWASLRQRGAF